MQKIQMQTNADANQYKCKKKSKYKCKPIHVQTSTNTNQYKCKQTNVNKYKCKQIQMKQKEIYKQN